MTDPVVLSPEHITALEALDEDVEWLPAAIQGRWRCVIHSTLVPHLKKAMRLRLEGHSQAAISRDLGINKEDVRRALIHYGLIDHARAMGSTRLLDNHREIAQEGTERMIDSLSAGEKMSPGLAVVVGISTDKVAMKERWNQADPSSEGLGNVLLEIADRVVKGGGRLDLTIEGPGGTAKIEAGK